MSEFNKKSTSKKTVDAELLKSIRQRLLFTQAEMAVFLGLNRSYLAELENGSRPITSRVLAKALEINRQILTVELLQEQELKEAEIVNEFAALVERSASLPLHDLGEIGDLAKESMKTLGPGPGDFFGPILLIIDKEMRNRHRAMMEKFRHKKGAASNQVKNPALTQKVNSLTFDDVKPVLPKLIQRLNRVTEARGRKSELAAWLGVHRQMVTDWLSGKQEPGGEITLRLLQWVEQQERQK